MSSDSDELMCTPPEIIEKAKTAIENLLPKKSRDRYETVYHKFIEWKLKNKVNSLSENVMLAYFEELSTTMKPSSLWAIYSMLRATINIKHDKINIATYPKLIALLKRKADGFKSKKSKTLTSKNINDFLQNAPDTQYLFMKVVLIIAVSGACRKQELRNIKPEHVQDTGESLIITIPDSKTKTQRSFVVPKTFYPTCKKYMNLRPSGDDTKSLPFFLNYINQKCTKQCVGINKIGSVPKNIAEYLGLPDPKQYTGHCFRRSSATILVDAGGDLLALKRHGGWRSSSVAEGYVDNSVKNKTDNSLKIASAINNSPTTSNNHVTISEHNVTASCSQSTSSHKTNTTDHSLVFNNCSVTINNYYK
ncbi:hypothetical protein Zmor_014801 [Zophobas morio]|uniref:Tyr recombinase domain-containing protein n=1 Tax=Zophobas morio TaxID=2755281 RepID=A0AA38IFY5_9CUCU|nr:hypothetical protein Zmor_014801 [Zophobas morio]